MVFPYGLSLNFPFPRLQLFKPLCMLHDPHMCLPHISCSQLLAVRPQKDSGHKKKLKPFGGALFSNFNQWWDCYSLIKRPQLLTVCVSQAQGSLLRRPWYTENSPGKGTLSSMRERMSILPKSCIPKERSCLFFPDTYWNNEWPKFSINNFLYPLVLKQCDFFPKLQDFFPIIRETRDNYTKVKVVRDPCKRC